MNSPKKKLGLVLSGGGARGAYQAGVLRGVAEIASRYGLSSPFSVYTGVSAGSINAAFLACYADQFARGTEALGELWGGLQTSRIYKTDAFSLGRTGFRWFRQLSAGALRSKRKFLALLDTSPLRDLLTENLNLDRIPELIDKEYLKGLSISATDYATSVAVTYLQTTPEVKVWERARRLAIKEKITVDHVLASSAIPVFFPPVRVGNGYFGDGCLRNSAPLSPAIHLGAEKLLIVSVKKQEAVAVKADIQPTLARVLSVVLNAILMDAIDLDVERLSRINRTLQFAGSTEAQALKPVDYLWITPSEDIGAIAKNLFDQAPKTIRFLLQGLGSKSEGAEIASYLLFESEYTSTLLKLGHADALKQTDKVEELLLT